MGRQNTRFFKEYKTKRMARTKQKITTKKSYGGKTPRGSRRNVVNKKTKKIQNARRDDTDTATRFASCRSMLNNSAIIGGGAEVFRFLHIPKTGGANVEKFLGLKHQTHTR